MSIVSTEKRMRYIDIMIEKILLPERLLHPAAGELSTRMGFLRF